MLGGRSQTLRTVLRAHRRPFRAGRRACRSTLSHARRSLFPYRNREIWAELFTKVTGNTALWFGYVRITPFVHCEGLFRAESNAVAAPFAPGGIKTYVGTGFLCFNRLIFSCGHVSFGSHSTIMGTVQRFCKRSTEPFTAKIAENAENYTSCPHFCLTLTCTSETVTLPPKDWEKALTRR
jgi:hypothetical protein